MTLKQRFFINKYLTTGNASEAAMEVYNVKKRSVAAQIGYENLRKPDIKKAIKDYFTHKRLLPTYVIESFVDVLKNGTTIQKLNASKAYFKIKGIYPD